MGENFRFRQEVVSRREIEAWLDSDGRDVLLAAVRRTPVRRLFGTRRARRALRLALFAEVNGDPRLRRAVECALDELPSVVQDLAAYAVSSQLRVLVRFDHCRRLVVVPRALLRRVYGERVTARLKTAPSLGRYASFRRFLLARKAADAESVFFEALRKTRVSSLGDAKWSIAGVDADREWSSDSLPGHYYVAGSGMSGGTTPGDAPNGRALAKLRVWMESFDDEIGRLSPESRASMLNRLHRAATAPSHRPPSSLERTRSTIEEILSR